MISARQRQFCADPQCGHYRLFHPGGRCGYGRCPCQLFREEDTDDLLDSYVEPRPAPLRVTDVRMAPEPGVTTAGLRLAEDVFDGETMRRFLEAQVRADALLAEALDKEGYR